MMGRDLFEQLELRAGDGRSQTFLVSTERFEREFRMSAMVPVHFYPSLTGTRRSALRRRSTDDERSGSTGRIVFWTGSQVRRIEHTAPWPSFRYSQGQNQKAAQLPPIVLWP
jgi:hypothetical protein